MRRCPACGTPADDGRFCDGCGAALPPVEQVAAVAAPAAHPPRPFAQPGALKFVTDWLAPVNTITILGIGVADLLTPWLGRQASLGVIALAAVALAATLMLSLARSGAAHMTLGVLLRQRSVLAAVFIIVLAFGVMASKAALAAPSGLAAALAPDVVGRLQQSLGLIEAQGQLTHRKLDEVQEKLKDLKTDKLRLLTLIEQSRASQDRALREASADYEGLAQHQKDALALLRARQGRQMDARRMIALVRQYGSAEAAQRPVIAETAARALGDKDESSRLILAMMLDPGSYQRVLGASGGSDASLWRALQLHALDGADAERLARALVDSVQAASAGPGGNEILWLAVPQGSTGSVTEGAYLFVREGENLWRLVDRCTEMQVPMNAMPACHNAFFFFWIARSRRAFEAQAAKLGVRYVPYR